MGGGKRHERGETKCKKEIVWEMGKVTEREKESRMGKWKGYTCKKGKGMDERNRCGGGK